jgi:N-acetylglucosamine-6-sulfatase
MPRTIWIPRPLAAAVAAAGSLLLAAGCATDSETSGPPNIVVINLDDLDFRTFEVMQSTQSLLTSEGVSFRGMVATRALCCPSRASFLTGRYSHNHGVLSNLPPLGGYLAFRQHGDESSTLATWLSAAGYRTALFGKYLNGFPFGAPDFTYIPPGWTEWYSEVLDDESGDATAYLLNENGTLISYSDSEADYEPDVLAAKAIDFVRRTGGVAPFFAFINPPSPHAPARAAQRYADAFPGAMAPRLPSFNEADISDKPAWLRAVPLLTGPEIADIDDLARHRYQSLLAIDDMVNGLMDALASTDQLSNTYIFFTSDQGVFMGQHRLPGGKNAPYEEAIRVPLIVRGPGVPAGRIVDHVVANVDLAPTIAELAGAPWPSDIDGISLVPLLRRSIPSLQSWRADVLIEASAGGSPYPLPAFAGLRGPWYTYVEYATGEREFYDLRNDPYELQSSVDGLTPEWQAYLTQRVAQLRSCAGASCNQ